MRAAHYAITGQAPSSRADVVVEDLADLPRCLERLLTS
jgi:hypothetical protein